jgi:hypothetical protein
MALKIKALPVDSATRPSSGKIPAEQRSCRGIGSGIAAESGDRADDAAPLQPEHHSRKGANGATGNRHFSLFPPVRRWRRRGHPYSERSSPPAGERSRNFRGGLLVLCKIHRIFSVAASTGSARMTRIWKRRARWLRIDDQIRRARLRSPPGCRRSASAWTGGGSMLSHASGIDFDQVLCRGSVPLARSSRGR